MVACVVVGGETVNMVRFETYFEGVGESLPIGSMSEVRQKE